MRYFVNENCIGCGMCEQTCPAVFSMNENGVAQAIEDEVAPEYREAAKKACEECPVGAIEEKIKS